MGNVHDLSGYDRESMIVEFTELAKVGLQTPQPHWMAGRRVPEWAAETRDAWREKAKPVQEEMVKALSEQAAPEKPKPAPAAKPAAAATAAPAPVKEVTT